MKEGGGEGERLPSFTVSHRGGKEKEKEEEKEKKGREDRDRKVETEVDLLENMKKRK